MEAYDKHGRLAIVANFLMSFRAYTVYRHGLIRGLKKMTELAVLNFNVSSSRHGAPFGKVGDPLPGPFPPVSGGYIKLTVDYSAEQLIDRSVIRTRIIRSGSGINPSVRLWIRLSIRNKTSC